VIAAVCCFTTILVVLLGAIGLGAITGYLDYVMLPAPGGLSGAHDLRSISTRTSDDGRTLR
jgi:hypothetical protein